jgi:PAS domain S-box-containing protein
MQKKNSPPSGGSRLHKQKGDVRSEIGEKYRLMVDNAAEGIAVTQGGISKRVETDLLETKKLFSKTFHALQDLVVVIDKDLRIRMSNWRGHAYVSEKDRQGFPHCYKVLMKRNKPCSPCHAREVFATGQINQLEAVNPIDGKFRDIRVLPIFDDDGNVVAVIEHLRDISDRKQMEVALRESQQRFMSIFENAPIGFYRTTPDGRVLNANPALIQMLGYKCFEELAAVNLETDDYHPEYSRREFRERIERGGEIKGMETFWRRPDGTLVYMRENARAIRDDDGNIKYYEGTVEDVTDQRQAEEHVRSLSQQLIQAQESERQMISRELHDRVAQDLSTLKIGLDTLFDTQPAASSEIRQKAAEFSKILDRTILTVRDLTYDLRPPGLDDMGLVAALSMYCEEFAEKSRIMVDFQAYGLESLPLNFNTEINLYRLVQEGLNNIRKHADATRAIVRLVGSFPNLILRIEDDGRGFNVEERTRPADSGKRMGLRSMAERVNLLGGQMKIRSRLKKGTKIKIKLPCPENTDDSKNLYLYRR